MGAGFPGYISRIAIPFGRPAAWGLLFLFRDRLIVCALPFMEQLCPQNIQKGNGSHNRHTDSPSKAGWQELSPHPAHWRLPDRHYQNGRA